MLMVLHKLDDARFLEHVSYYSHKKVAGQVERE